MREKEQIEKEVASSDHDAVVGEKMEQYEQQINEFHGNKKVEASTKKLHTDWADVCNNPDYALQVE